MDSAILGQPQLKTELTGAVERGEFVVYYQPTVELSTGRLAGMEALVRWAHPDRGLVPPLEFIPLAEQTGLIVPIGRFVLREACRQLSRWHAAHPDALPLTVSVNLSARELTEPGLVESVRSTLTETGLDPRRLVLEITESLLLVDLPRTVRTLGELRAMGLRLAIDDFGTGYSSLAYLENLPVDILKIDKSFVDRLTDRSVDPRGGADVGDRDGVMVAAISQLGHSLDLQLVAEGIEHAQQVTVLSTLSCEYGQGFYFARPLTAEAFEALLGQPAHRRGWHVPPSTGSPADATADATAVATADALAARSFAHSSTGSTPAGR
jgi:EAL domain-containing protein (putative c-di-GMP-specific phosphodiesterase class I)